MTKKGKCQECGTPTTDRYATLCRPCWKEHVKPDAVRPPTEGEIKEVNKRRYENRRRYIYKTRYGITKEQYQEILEAQDSCCAICGTHQSELGKRMSVDHDHNCCPGLYSCGKCLRGLLCGHCNLALGGFKDKESVLRSALRYLSIYRNEEYLD